MNRKDWWVRVKERITYELPPSLFSLIASFYFWLRSRRYPFFTVPLSPSCWVLLSKTAKGKFFTPEPINYFGGVYWQYCGRGFMVERGDIVLDVGAWAGDFTIVAALKTGKGGRVIAVEPHPTNLLFLKHNVSKLGNVMVVEKALWKRKGRMRLFEGHHSGYHSLVAGKEEHLKDRGAYVWVETETLDGLVSSLGLERIDFLKMDVEGAELEILQGGERALELTRKVAIAAYHTRKGKPSWKRVQEILEGHGFRTQVTEDLTVRGWKLL